jgi:hypothetical protein
LRRLCAELRQSRRWAILLFPEINIKFAAAVTCAAIFLPAVALAAPGHSAASAHATPTCAAKNLIAWIGLPSENGAGSARYQLELSNKGSSNCTLDGFPGVSAYGNAPHFPQLGSAAIRDHSHQSSLITLSRGGTAHVELFISDSALTNACHPVEASGLKIYAPNDRRGTSVQLPFEACQKKGTTFMSVSAVINRAGVPLFSS